MGFVGFFEIECLAKQLKEKESIQDKLEILQGTKSDFSALQRTDLSDEEELVIKSVIAIGQASRVLRQETLSFLLSELLPVERFYKDIGGIVGYHAMILRFLEHKEEIVADAEEKLRYHRPDGISIEENAEQAVLEGIIHMPLMAEIYPLGGAADRLRLSDPVTKEPLPAARLLFCGKTLLEALVTDLQAREYLYYKLFHKQLTTPIAIMTSQEKNNHAHIVAICEEKEWFGRPKKSFRFFCQPFVPTLTSDGNWCVGQDGRLLLKPGGHGVIWKLAKDEGVFEWFFSQKRKKALVRQVNNPIAGIDHGLLAFTGLGCSQNKLFGFASCLRRLQATEGINVLVERQKECGSEYVLTNIEYCDFAKRGIADSLAAPSSPYSQFPSNTNILFIDLQAVLQAVESNPIPGMLINLKKTAYVDERGESVEKEVVRLESTMQNIADSFVVDTKEELKTFITYNKREKTISTLKRSFVLGSSLFETPEGCFIDLMANARDLLVQCQVEVPSSSFIFLYHSALGPLYSIIAQKLRGGIIGPGSELQLHLAEVDIENLQLNGSLYVIATDPLGEIKENVEKNICYSEQCGKCTLKNVVVENRGINWQANNIFWKNEIAREACCHIAIEGNGEFYAENVTLSGDLKIEVKKGTKVTAKQTEAGLCLEVESISAPTWHWSYSIHPSAHTIHLQRSPG